MNMTLLRLATALLTLSGSQSLLAQATPLQPADFASGRVLRLEGNAPFYRISLPPELYTGTAYPDLRDLRIFNGNSEALPFAIVRPSGTQGATRSIALQSFRLGDKQDSIGTPAIELLAPGVRLHVAGAGEAQGAAEYLLTADTAKDASPPAINSLHLDWEPPGGEAPGNWQQRVQVEGSHDLKYWAIVVREHPVMDLQNGAQRFVQADIPFDYVQEYRYWRLRFAQGKAPALRSVSARLASERTSPSPIRIAATPIDGREGERAGLIAHYRLPASVRLSALRILPQQPNSVVPLHIETRVDDKSDWQAWGSTVAYRLSSAEGERQSSTVSGPERNARELRLSAVGPGWGGLAPTVQVEREALDLVFNARGNGPWLLAWGSRAASDASLPFDTLQTGYQTDNLDALPRALSGAVASLGGVGRLSSLAPAEKAQRWRTALVWAALIAGAAVLAWLAFSVWKQTRET